MEVRINELEDIITDLATDIYSQATADVLKNLQKMGIINGVMEKFLADNEEFNLQCSDLSREETYDAQRDAVRKIRRLYEKQEQE